MPDVIMYADTFRSPELRHEVPLGVPDPFLYVELGGVKHIQIGSMEIPRLAELGLDGRIHTAAITYDPEFDLPARLRSYGENREVVFSPSDRLFRTTGALAPLEDYFALGVSFGGTLVNRHRIEVFLLDHKGRVAGAFTRLQWDVDEVLAEATSLLEPA